MSRKKILIVEDDLISAELYKVILEKEGFVVVDNAQTAEQAFEVTRNTHLDLILMDIGLKGKTNGIETARELKKFNIPIVFVTGNSNKNVYIKAKEIKPAGYITKPINPKDFLTTIDLAINNNDKVIPKNLYLRELQKKNIIQEVGERAFKFFEDYFEEENKKNLVVSTTTMFNIINQPEENFDTIINLQKVNNIKRVNKFFENINAKLCDGGIFIGHAETKGFMKKKILSKYPPVINYFFYIIYFLYKRVWPKIPLLRKIYFFLTKGRNRAISRAEVLGRLYSCGFEVLKEEFIDSNLHFIAKKIKAPFYDMNASYDFVFKMKRVGKGGKLIYVYKLRTMYPFSEYLQSYIYQNNDLAEGGKIKNDFRISTAGRIFRKFWIDELPMLINFVKGDLKIVGVRPLSQHFFSLYPEDMQIKRIKYKPGLIPPFYADMPKTFEEIIESERKYLDLYEKEGFIVDIKYFFKAFWNIFFKKARSA